MTVLWRAAPRHELRQGVHRLLARWVIAGPDGDLSWLPEPDPGGEDYGYAAFMSETAAILDGTSQTYETAARFERWPYGDTPVFVAASRPLEPDVASVLPIAAARKSFSPAVRSRVDGGLYLDGGALIRSFVDEGWSIGWS